RSKTRVRASGLRTFSSFADDFDVLSSQLADAIEVTVGDGAGLDELAAYAEAAGAGLQEGGGRRQVYAAGRHQPRVRPRRPEGFEERWPDHFGGEDFYDVGAGFPRGEDFRRCKGAGHDQLVVALAKANDFEIHGGRDHVLRPGQEGRPRGLRIENRARAQEQ